MKKLLPILLASLILVSGACTKQSCPTYSEAPEKLPATYADLETYMRQDTTKHRFSAIEKTGAVLGIIFIVYASEQSQ